MTIGVLNVKIRLRRCRFWPITRFGRQEVIANPFYSICCTLGASYPNFIQSCLILRRTFFQKG
jgi:hypothetical protein